MQATSFSHPSLRSGLLSIDGCFGLPAFSAIFTLASGSRRARLFLSWVLASAAWQGRRASCIPSGLAYGVLRSLRSLIHPYIHPSIQPSIPTSVPTLCIHPCIHSARLGASLGAGSSFHQSPSTLSTNPNPPIHQSTGHHLVSGFQPSPPTY
ncbi:hypothetical protein BJ875DRAFT_467727 [Amylocarpus encephaloides]|uniref:Uncharacterized protein n=1 Tax=Amylocarpus encephaloides TaxID=45428 RepID=A0A9P7YEE3_9HELO|nr:hypothetical protein BJ875DRAFT_467727 [Amylocarpus encephaloides]